MTLLKLSITMLFFVVFYMPSFAQETSNLEKKNSIQFSEIEQVPLYPGCETLTANEERKRCMRDKVSKFVNRSFNISVADSLKSGLHKIVVNFEIDNNGEIAHIEAKAAYSELKEEAKRVIQLLPKMQPGKHEGETVGVSFELPISFRIAD